MPYEEQNESNIDKILRKIGILPYNVNAAVCGTDTDISSSGALKSYLVVSQSAKNQKVYVTYTATWLKEAKHRKKMY